MFGLSITDDISLMYSSIEKAKLPLCYHTLGARSAPRNHVVGAPIEE